MEHASRVVGITVANNLITYVDYTDNVVLFFQQATQYVDVDVVTAMQYESAKLGLHVSWSKTWAEKEGEGEKWEKGRKG